MQINVITQSVGVEETLGSCTAEQPIDADITLPDYCPDIRRVLKCLVTPRITAVQTAGDRATADGSAGVCVIYADEQGTVCCFEQTYPFSKYADLKGADENCCVNVRAYTQYANCRAVSPRRLDIHAVVSVAFGISGVKEEEIITGAEGAGIQLRCCDSRTASLVACTETAFPMSETVPLPDGDPAVSCVLSAQAAALAQEIKVISNKLLVKGELTVSAVCRGEGGEIFSFGHSMPISQIINLEGIDEDCTCCVCLPVTSLEVLSKVDQAGDNRLIDISARVGAGVKAYRELSFPTVTDAYSVCCDLETKSRNADFAVIADKFNDTFTCRSTQDLPEARQILALWCSDLSKSVAQDSDGIIISGELTLHFLYTDAESQPCYAQRQTNYEYRRAVRKCGDLKCSPCIEITAASAACASGSADVRVEMNISGCIFDSVRRKTVTSIECSDSDGKKTGGAALTVYFADAGEEIWDIARRYNTTVEAVEQENGITGETVAQKCMLLIPGV